MTSTEVNLLVRPYMLWLAVVVLRRSVWKTARDLISLSSSSSQGVVRLHVAEFSPVSESG